MASSSQWMQQVRQSTAGRWFFGRDTSEQRILLVIGAVLAVLLLWSLLLKPLSDWQAFADNRYENARETLDWLRANEARARASATSQTPGNAPRSIIAVITRAADAAGLKLNRLQPEANGGVSVVLQQQPFNDVLRWMAQLQENNGVRVERADIDAQEISGLVNVQLRLN